MPKLTVMSATAELVQDTQDRILDAAEERFSRYGFGKTTVAEIAADCGMSAGNLYRFFSNKEEIGARIACRCMAEREQTGREILARPGLAAGRRLEDFAAGISLHIHAMVTRDLLKSDLVEYISSKRWDLVTDHIDVLRGLIAEILAEGVRSGEFHVPEIERSAMLVLNALKGVLYPPFIADMSAEELEADARGIAKLLVRGLRK